MQALAQEKMEQNGMELLVLKDIPSFEHFVFAAHYAAGAPDLVLIPLEGDPVIIANSLTSTWVTEQTWVDVDNILTYYLYSPNSERTYTPDMKSILKDFIPIKGVVGFDYSHISVGNHNMLKDILKPEGTADCTQILKEVFELKSLEEVEKIRAAAEVSEIGVKKGLECIGEGISEYEVMAEVEGAMKRKGAIFYPLFNDIYTGEACWNIGDRAAGRIAGKGDMFILDLQPNLDHYFADIARSMAVSDPTPDQRKMNETVLEALEVAEDTMRPGIKACDLDMTIKSFFEKKGYMGKFPHHTGHPVGNLWGPSLVSTDTTVLEEGMVLTLEPGLYLDRTGGIRIEDNFLITDRGCESLMTLERDLLCSSKG